VKVITTWQDPIRRALADKVDPRALQKLLGDLYGREIPLPSGKVFACPTEAQALTIADALVDKTVRYLLATRHKAIVIPMSGGADSTLMAAILRAAVARFPTFARDHQRDATPPLIVGVTLPIKLQDDANEYDDLGLAAARLYADEVVRIPLGNLHQQVIDDLFGANAYLPKCESGSSLVDLVANGFGNNRDAMTQAVKVVKGSTAARLRMIFCYGWASLLQGAQCSTDNLTEALTGFWTLCGDEGTFKVIQCLLKGLEQPQVMAALGIPDIYILKPPTDGLGVGDGDVAQLYGALYTGGETYQDVDTVLLRYFDGMDYDPVGGWFVDPKHPEVEPLDHPVVRWHIRTHFKRSPWCVTRTGVGLPSIPGLTYNT